MLYDSLRLWGGSESNEAVSADWSAKERPSRAWAEGGEARSVVFYEGLRLREAHLYVFYEAGRLLGCRESNQAWRCSEVGWVR